MWRGVAKASRGGRFGEREVVENTGCIGSGEKASEGSRLRENEQAEGFIPFILADTSFIHLSGCVRKGRRGCSRAGELSSTGFTRGCPKRGLATIQQLSTLVVTPEYRLFQGKYHIHYTPFTIFHHLRTPACLPREPETTQSGNSGTPHKHHKLYHRGHWMVETHLG